MSSGQTINLIISGATLLSGGLDACQTPNDETCIGGIAAVLAVARQFAQDGDNLIIQKLDTNSPFVNMHPLQWVVNRLILHEIFGLEFFIASPALLLQNKVDSKVSKRDISGLQDASLPLLLSNVVVPPSNSWYHFTKNVHFDKQTGLAVINIADKGVQMTLPQSDAAIGALNYISQLNKRNGCSGLPTDYQEYTTAYFSAIIAEEGIEDSTQEDNQCWVSVILYEDIEENFWTFMEAVTAHEFSPDLIINIEWSYETFSSPQLYGNTGVWVTNCDVRGFCLQTIQLNDARQIQNITSIPGDINNIDDGIIKDATWESHITKLALLAQDAKANDPNIGYTEFIPVVRTGSYRACNAGECAVGNLFADSLRWRADSDVAFTSSGGYRGPGKEAGETRFGYLYAALPFTNTMCTGTMTGLSLSKLLNYTMSVATFQGEDTADGGRLLQVSGMQVTYNTELEGSRLVAVDIWDDDEGKYIPLDRLRLYKFATESYVCAGFKPYPALTGDDLVLEGEIPGTIGDLVIQNLVADYLGQLEEWYDTSIQGRLRNDTSVIEPLDLVQTEGSCGTNTIWHQKTLACVECPDYANVEFSDEILEFQTKGFSGEIPKGKALLLNREPFYVTVSPTFIPSWLKFTSGSVNSNEMEVLTRQRISLEPGEILVLEFNVTPASIASGTDRTAQGTVAFEVKAGESFAGCSGQNPSFDVALRVTPDDDPNHLGSIRYVGFGLGAVVLCTALFYVIWVYRHRMRRVVKIMQPRFLLAVCFGVCVLATAVVPLSIDEGVIPSVRGCSMACMSIPWLLSMGFTIAFGALYAKLLRINRLLNAGLVRVVVQAKDVVAPFAVLFTLNLIVLLVWTITDPLRWERVVVNNEEWNTVGMCSGGTGSKVMVSLLSLLNFGALMLACHQAFKARNISDEFSESKHIGVAIYGWFQILVVAFPPLFLIDSDNSTARYFLEVALIFILSMSMLLIISLPAVLNIRNETRPSTGRVRISGLDTGSTDRPRPTTQDSGVPGRDMLQAMAEASNSILEEDSDAPYPASAMYADEESATSSAANAVKQTATSSAMNAAEESATSDVRHC
jgi:hypothetical protein